MPEHARGVELAETGGGGSSGGGRGRRSDKEPLIADGAAEVPAPEDVLRGGAGVTPQPVLAFPVGGTAI